MSEFSLAGDFPTADAPQWRALVDKALKGADFDESLVSQTYDGLRIEPLYRRPADDAEPLPRALRKKTGDAAWDIRQRHAAPNPATANKAILQDLEGGVTSLALRIAAPGQFGLAVRTADDLARALEGVHLDLAGVSLEAGQRFAEMAAGLQEVWRRKGLAGDRPSGNMGADPIGALAMAGGLDEALEQMLGRAADLATACRDEFPNVRAMRADARIHHDGGASEAQELAFLIATTVAYLRALEASGLAPADAMRQIGFALSVDADQFLSIAKLRAARALLTRIAAASGADDAIPSIRIEAQTSERMMARRDPHVNMLRTTVACAAAALGGADAITVLPYCWANGRPDAFAHRMARNTQIILLEESALGQVGDPAGGSGYLETVTGQLAARAWELFQDIERRGGMAEALSAGAVQAMIRETSRARARDIALARAELTGVSAFPDLGETAIGAEPHPVPDDLEDPAVTVEPVPPRRDAEPFERLRDAADAFRERTGRAPVIFLATLGRPSDFTARATYARSLFAAGGIDGLSGDGLATPEDAAAAFKGSGAEIACLCSSDAVYADRAEATGRALNEAGAAHILLAGRPGERRQTYKAAGIASFIHQGCDIVETLEMLHDLLDVPPVNG